jgi:hypothetical protein
MSQPLPKGQFESRAHSDDPVVPNASAVRRRSRTGVGQTLADEGAARPQARARRERDSVSMTEYAPPTCPEVELAVLAALMNDPQAAGVALERLRESDFYGVANPAIFASIKRVVQGGSKVDILTVTEDLRQAGKLDHIGGVDAVQRIVEHVQAISHVEDHVRIVRCRAQSRAVLGRLRTMYQLVGETGLDPGKLIELLPGDSVSRAIVAALGEIIDADSAAGAPGSRSLVCIDSDSFLANQYPKPAPILEPWLRESQLAMAYGWRGTGKSWFAAGIACAVASAGTFLRWRAPSSRRVVLVDGELPAATLQDRIRSTCKVIGAKPAQNLRLIAMSLQERGIPSLDTEEGQRLIDVHLEGTSLLVLDSLSTLVRSGTLNDEETWLPVQAWLIGLRTRGISVLLLHHSGKSGAQRGHSRIEDCLDVSISLRQPDDYCAEQGARFEIKFEKTRGLFGEAASGFEALLQTGPDGAQAWTTRDLVDAWRSRIVDLQREGLSQKEIAKKIGCHTSTVSRHLKAARSDGSLVKKEA